MEFLRFASSIPGSYWGCCACDVIQDFKQSPSSPASIQLVNGDGGYPLTNSKGEDLFLGTTYEEIFWQRLRIGTFGVGDLPDHAFLAILTSSQLQGSIGKQWLNLLDQAGFEFIRAVGNSVWTGAGVASKESQVGGANVTHNYIFGLFRNIGRQRIKDSYQAPENWPTYGSDPFMYVSENPRQAFDYQLEKWQALPQKKFYTEAELEALGVPITYAGVRSKFPQESKGERIAKQKKEEEKSTKGKATPNAFPTL